MAEKAKCKLCDKFVLSRGLCSTHYGQAWRRVKETGESLESVITALIATTTPEPPEPAETVLIPAAPIEPEIVAPERQLPPTHLVARNPVEMEAARDDLKSWLEQKLTQIEADIVETNAALNEARRNGWATTALTSARNRAIDDETFYNKILAAVEAGYTIIPDFPIQVFAVRRGEQPPERSQTYIGIHNASTTGLGQPVPPDCAPVGVGGYRNPLPATSDHIRENTLATPENEQPRYYTTVNRYRHPAGPITFPSLTARSPIMKATSAAMAGKVFDQIGVCHPNIPVGSERRVEVSATRAGDPLIIGQILRKRIGSKQKCVSFIIAWHLNLSEL